MLDLRPAPDIKKKVLLILRKLSLSYVKQNSVFCFRSYGSKSRAYARIWSFPRIWQKALKVKPAYCIEVLSEKFDKLKEEQKTKILIHEIMHIPKTFSGSVLAHRGRGRRIDKRRVEKFYDLFISR